MEVTFDITKFYSLKISSDIILVKPHKTSQGKGGVPLTFAQPPRPAAESMSSSP